MKKSLRKVIVTLSAVAALSLVMGATAMAAVDQTAVQNGKTTLTYSVEGKTADEQVTVLLLKPEADTTDGVQETEIAYIDQKAADQDGKVTFSMPISDVTEGTTYKLMSGSATAAAASSEDVVVGNGSSGDINYGDVDGNEAVDVLDALEMLKYASFMDSVFDADESLITVGDIDESGDVDVLDALEVLKYASFMDTEYEDKFAWAE